MAIKMAMEQNIEPKKQIIHLILSSPIFFGSELSIMKGVMTAFPNSGSHIGNAVRDAIDYIYGRADEERKQKIILHWESQLDNKNLKIRNLAKELLDRYRPKEVREMHPYSHQEIQTWTLSNPKLYNPNNFKFLIHGVLTTELRPDDSTLGTFLGKNVYQDRDAFLQRKRICTSLIGIDSEKKISEVRTFAPTGVILSVPRENITHASNKNFASNGKFVSRKNELLTPEEILKNVSGKYTEIVIEGTNRVSQTKTDIIGIFIKEGTTENLCAEAKKFASDNNLPIIMIPGKWTNTF